MIFSQWHQRVTDQWLERLHMMPYQAMWFA